MWLGLTHSIVLKGGSGASATWPDWAPAFLHSDSSSSAIQLYAAFHSPLRFHEISFFSHMLKTLDKTDHLCLQSMPSTISMDQNLEDSWLPSE